MQPVRKKPSSRAISFKHFLQRVKRSLSLDEETFEESTFYIYRTDTNAVLARNIDGFEEAKSKATRLRRALGLKFDQVKFRSERGRASGTFGVSRSGQSFTNAYGDKYPMDYSRNYNPSKRGRFRGYYDNDGNFHDID
jgi:hypothetical protein